MGGACAHGSSLIQLPNGELISIKNLVENKQFSEVVSIDTKTLKLTISKITDYVDSGIQPTLKIKIDSGRTIQGTLDHPLIIKPRETRKPQWERLENLKVGMQVAVPKSTPFFGKYENKDARLIGMLIGDGSYGDKAMVQYCGEDDELWDYVDNNYPNAINIYNTYQTKLDRTYRKGTIRGIIPIVRDAGIYGQTKRDKRLPINYNSYTKESLAELLGGLFDTDGDIRIEENRKPTISISQISLELIQEIQMALLKFGVHSKIQERTYSESAFGKTGDYIYVLNIRGKESIENFHKNIKFLIKRKQDVLEKSVELLKSHKYKIQKDLFDTDLRFEKIVSIEDGGLEQVYDLTVEGVHNFIANGIINHNTNAKLIKIGTPRTRNHFYKSVEGTAEEDKNDDGSINSWCVVKRDWTECPQLWKKSGAIYLPDYKGSGQDIPYSKYVLELMPKALKQELFPNNPEVWRDGV